jgi:hypothetical protein
MSEAIMGRDGSVTCYRNVTSRGKASDLLEQAGVRWNLLYENLVEKRNPQTGMSRLEPVGVHEYFNLDNVNVAAWNPRLGTLEILERPDAFLGKTPVRIIEDRRESESEPSSGHAP